MKKEMLLAMVACFFISLTAITGVYAIEKSKETVTLSKEEMDITGDGKDDVILLKGVPYEEEDSFLKRIYLEVAASNEKTYTLSLESGSKASVQLIDLNNDGVKDLFTSVLSEENEGTVINLLYSLKDFVVTKLAVPEPLEMESHFLNNFKAEIRLAQSGKSYIFNLKDRKNYYRKMGVYYKGKLNEPTELTVNTFSSLNPVTLEGEIKGLKGIQRVTGIANGDTIALVESTWIFDNGHWRLLYSDVKKDQSK
jgi:hypothetical protein